ncbi:MAG: pilus assembly protein [Alphaproteobacteria bacterium]|nr:pilus assembly protein [Alphaproteobacteria bacterium]
MTSIPRPIPRPIPRSKARFASSESGAVAVMFALMLPVLFGIVGLGVEAGIWFKEKRELQTLTDAAAVSAAIERTHGADAAALSAAALVAANANGFDAASDTVLHVGAPTSGPHAGDAEFVEVRVKRALDTILSQVFHALDYTATARAVAGTVGDMDACLLTLDPSSANSVSINGAGTSVNVDGCAVVANSSDPDAVNVANGEMDAECIWTAGGIGGEENIDTTCEMNITGATTVPDPLAALAVPPYDPVGCLHGPGVNPYSPSDGEVLSEGVYCNGISVSAGDTVTLSDGIYILDEGDFKVNAGAHVQSSGPQGVTIILTSSSGSGYGRININGGGSVALQAQTAPDASGTVQGDYTGILFYQDRAGGSSPSLDNVVTGGSDVELTGAVYSPNNDISFSGGSTLDNNDCLILIAQNVSFNGSADLDNSCDMFGGNPVRYGAAPVLVE